MHDVPLFTYSRHQAGEISFREINENFIYRIMKDHKYKYIFEEISPQKIDRKKKEILFWFQAWQVTHITYEATLNVFNICIKLFSNSGS